MAGDRRRHVVSDLILTASTVLRMVAEDPSHFAVQAVRRLAPRGWAARWRRESTGGRPSQLSALRWFLLDRPDRAAEDLKAIGFRGRIARELGAALGLLGPGELTGNIAARAWLLRGELTRAIAAAPRRSRVARRARSERTVFTPGMTLGGGDVSGAGARPDGHAASRLGARAGARVGARAGSGVSPGPPRPPRVLFILTNSLPYTQSGYTMRTHQILTELRRQGVEVLAVTRIGYPVTIGRAFRRGSQVVDGVEYRRLPAWWLPTALDRRLGLQARRLGRIVEEFRPDAVHTTTDLTNGVVARAVAEAYAIPWVYEMRGQLELSWVARRPAALQAEAASSERVRLWRERDPELARAADLAVVLSGVQRDEMIARGVDAGSIVELPNCVPDDVVGRVPVDPADARARLGLPREGRWVGSVTAVVDYEGLDTLLDAVALARDAGGDMRVVIVGDGVSRPGLVAQAERLGLGPDVCVMPGRVPANQAVEWYEALDVFAVPRRDTPVCRVVTPLKPITALALGRPVVCSDLPPLAELADVMGDAVTLVRSGDADALADAITAAQSVGRPSPFPYVWGDAVHRLVAAYERLRA